MKASILIPKETNGFFSLVVDDVEFATIYSEELLDKAIEVVLLLDPSNTLQNDKAKQFLKLQLEKAMAERQVKIIVQKIERLNNAN